MNGQVHRHSWWATITAKIRNERGLSMPEYTVLIAVIALVAFFGLQFLGSQVDNQIGVGGLSVQYGDYVAGECPEGNWDLTHVDDAPVKNGPDPNQNGDNYVCVKSDTGDGNGNSGQNANNKDNNADPVDNG